MNTKMENFWEKYLEKAVIAMPELYRDVIPRKKNWLHTRRDSYPFGTVVNQKQSWVEICFQEKSQEESIEKFEELFARREAIERNFGAKLRWARSGNDGNAIRSKIMSIQIPMGSINTDSWDDLIDRLIDEMLRFVSAIEHFGKPSVSHKQQVKYQPAKIDIEAAASQIPLANGNLDAVLVQVEKNLLAAGKELQDGWRITTEKKISIWFK
jgi:hypothetical protein